MTTEDEFQAALDVKPDDWNLRLAFAKWLHTQNDPRADGMRAIAAQRLCFCDQRASGQGGFMWIPQERAVVWELSDSTPEDWTDMPPDWFEELRGGDLDESLHVSSSVVYPNRRAADDAAALAFAQLPAQRQAELLAGD